MITERFIDANGIRTRYFELNDGPTVVLFHGGHLGSAIDACSAQDWQPVLTPMSRAFRVIAVDRLGHGGTDNPKTDADYTIDASIRHAADFLQALNCGPCHVVGHSTGGFLAARLAIGHPELVKSCVLADAVSLYPGTGREHIVLAEPPKPYHTRDSLRWVSERQFYNSTAVDDDWIDHKLAIIRSDRNRIAVRKMNDDGLRATTYLPSFAQRLGPTHRYLLETGMPCPTLLTWSLEDPVGDISNGRLLVEMFQEKQPRTEVRYFNKTGHYSFREQPAAFALMLRHYLAALA